MKTTKKWKCVSCDALLGTIEDEAVVNIRRKETKVSCEGGRVTTSCPHCQTEQHVDLFTLVHRIPKARLFSKKLEE